MSRVVTVLSIFRQVKVWAFEARLLTRSNQIDAEESKHQRVEPLGPRGSHGSIYNFDRWRFVWCDLRSV